MDQLREMLTVTSRHLIHYLDAAGAEVWVRRSPRPSNQVRGTLTMMFCYLIRYVENVGVGRLGSFSSSQSEVIPKVVKIESAKFDSIGKPSGDVYPGVGRPAPSVSVNNVTSLIELDSSKLSINLASRTEDRLCFYRQCGKWWDRNDGRHILSKGMGQRSTDILDAHHM